MDLNQLIRERPLVFDGATGTNLQTQNLTPDDFGGEHLAGCNEYLIRSKPSAVERVHSDYLTAGADIIETDTFGSASIVLAEYGLESIAYELSKEGAAIAKKMAQEFSTKEKPRFVAGSIGPTTKLPSLGHIAFDAMRDSYYGQMAGLLDGGADLFMIETCQDLLQIKAALAAAQDLFRDKRTRI
ncbi:MAG: homocysteine S-methyltransferase family protein, partial [Candidatus Kapaibacterium sp.]